jgi:hypothetical protein
MGLAISETIKLERNIGAAVAKCFATPLAAQEPFSSLK